MISHSGVDRVEERVKENMKLCMARWKGKRPAEVTSTHSLTQESEEIVIFTTQFSINNALLGSYLDGKM